MEKHEADASHHVHGQVAASDEPALDRPVVVSMICSAYLTVGSFVSSAYVRSDAANTLLAVACGTVEVFTASVLLHLGQLPLSAHRSWISRDWQWWRE